MGYENERKSIVIVTEDARRLGEGESGRGNVRTRRDGVSIKSSGRRLESGVQDPNTLRSGTVSVRQVLRKM